MSPAHERPLARPAAEGTQSIAEGGPARPTAIRGALLTFEGDPFTAGDAAVRYERDAIVAMAKGRIVDCGAAAEVERRLPPGTPVTHYANALISAGFVDAHVHYAQLGVIGAGGLPLLGWLERHTFPAESRYADAPYARDVAQRYVAESLRHGITTALVFCTVHPHSVDVLFESALALDLRTIAGKVLMDRHAPGDLLDTAQRGYDESKALIDRWTGRGRLGYAITPRFAATSSPEQLEAAGALWRERPGTWLQSHVAENAAEVSWIRELFPERAGYLHVYEHHGLLGPRAIYAHGIHLDERDWRTLHDSGSAIAHCPTSNNFLGSGLFRMACARDAKRPVHVALGSDVGGGTHLSMLRTMQAACEVAQMAGGPLSPTRAWWLATAGGAAALRLEDSIGTVAPGREADLVVLDLASTPLVEFRMRSVQGLDEMLGVQMALGDDRAIRATYAAGRLVHDRDA
jgi:guanine deaminase